MTLSQDKFDDLGDQVRRMLAAQGLSFEELYNCALDIVVFGSRAAGVHRSDSDLDLLIISDKSGHKRRGKLDLVFVPKTMAASPLWRRTEIARHIAQFGVSLMHERPLIDPIIDGYAAQRKQARLHTLVKSLLPCWQTLNAELKRKYFTRLRRELQRYQFLRQGHPVPPTAVLDSIMNSPQWVEIAFGDIENAANVTSTEAVRAYSLMTNEARRLAREDKRSANRNPERAA